MERQRDLIGVSEKGNSMVSNGMPVEMFVPAQAVIPVGNFEGDGVKIEPNLDNKVALSELRQAMVTSLPRKLLKAFFKGERRGWIYPVLGGAILLVGIYELKERKGEDFLNFIKKLDEAKRELQGKSKKESAK